MRHILWSKSPSPPKETLSSRDSDAGKVKGQVPFMSNGALKVMRREETHLYSRPRTQLWLEIEDKYIL